jgi:RHS repeat-associated protein
VNYTTTPQNVRTYFHCPSITDFHLTTNYPVSLISSIVLADGSTYSFTYEQTYDYPGYTTGRIASITLPTGGTISYTYPTGAGACPGGIQADGSGYQLTRTTNDLTPNPQTTFDRSTSGQTKVTTPDTTVTTVYFKNWYEEKRTVVTGSVQWRVIDTCYNGYVPSPAFPAADCRPQTVSPPFTEKKVYTTLDNSMISEVDAFYDGYGGMYRDDQYDFGSSAGTAPVNVLREIYSTYHTEGGVPEALTDVSVWSGPNQTGSQLSEVSYSYDSNGNVTSTTQGMVSGPQLTNSVTPNTYGMPSISNDPSSQQTSYAYDSTHTYLTTTTLPLTYANNLAHSSVTHSLGTTFDVYTGLLTGSTDDNSNSTAYTYDSRWRLHQVTFPDGGEQWFEYPSFNLAKVLTKISSAYTGNTETLLDGFGRTISAGTFVATNTWNRQDTCYDNMGRVEYVSSVYSWSGTDLSGSPTCPSTSAPGDTYTYDGISRVTAITHVDGSEFQYQYKGRATNIIEELNGSYRRNRTVQYDAIGRLTAVCEILASSDSITVGSVQTPATCGLDFTPTSLVGFLTTYTYDLLGDLLSVNQPGVGTSTGCTSASRCWTYDTLQRVTQEITPEAGTISYQYVPQNSNGAGQLKVMTRPAPNNTTTPASTVDTDYAYDEWGRLITKSYFYTGYPTHAEPNTPIVNYLYDIDPSWGSATSNPKSNMNEVWTAMPASLSTTVTASVFDYDSMGRVLHNGQCTPNTCSAIPTSTPYLMTYAYDLAGDMTSFTNNAPTTPVTFTYSYDTAARFWQLVSSRTGTNYPATLLSLAASGGGVQYGPYGPTGDTLGNGIVETFSYGNPASGQIPFFTGVTATKSSVTKYSLSLGVASNGFVSSANDSVNGNWTYGYDSLDRLKSASKSGTAMNWQYDLAGNRWNQNATAGSPPQPHYNFTGNSAGNNNKIDTASYDAMGNLLKDFNATPNNYAYDAEGRVYQVTGGTSAAYTYDGLGRRVKGPSYEYVFDLAGHPASILTYSGTTDTDYADQIYVGNRHVASYFGTGTYFVNSDHLGTERVRTDASANVCQTTTDLPYGDLQTFTTNTCADPDGRSIGGMEFDPETGLEHTLYRKYYSTPGRWMTPDPVGSTVADPTDPQSWNRYTYVSNSPVSGTDRAGLCDAIFAGFQQGPNSPSVQDIVNYATSIGANVIFDYAGLGVAGSFVQLEGGGVGALGSTTPYQDTIIDSYETGSATNTLAFSGGATTESTLVAQAGGMAAAPYNAVYYEPGIGIGKGPLVLGTNNTIILQGTGKTNALLNFFSGTPVTAPFTSTIDCPHSLQCSMANGGVPVSDAMSQNSMPCSDPKIYFKGGTIGLYQYMQAMDFMRLFMIWFNLWEDFLVTGDPDQMPSKMNPL